MRWLHISDLHFDEESAKQNYFEKAIEKRSKPDFIVVTGDLRTYPQNARSNKFKFPLTKETNSYAQANIFLQQLLDHWHLSKNDIFLVPGNHDVDVIPKYRALRALSNGTATLPPYSNGQKSSFMIKGIHLSKRFCEYAEFIRGFFGDTHEASQDSAGVFIRTWGSKINILHANTALYSTRNNFRESHVLDTFALSSLKLDDEQKKLPTIFLGHHSFFRLEQYLQDDVKTALENLNVVAYLCGDKHVLNRDKIVVGESRKSIPVITCMAGAIDKTFWPEIGVLIYTWNESLDDPVEVTALCWNPHRNIFTEHFLCSFNMGFDTANIQFPHLRRAVREQIKNLNPNLLPGIKNETDGTIYENKLLQSSSKSTIISHFPLEDIFLSKRHQNGKQLYLFEGTRSTRGGTGKTSSLLSVYRADELCREFQPVYIQLRNLNSNTLSDLVKYQVGPRNGRKLLLLLDGFDEITSDKLRKECIAQILKWDDEHYETDIIIMTGRDHLEFYLQVTDTDTLDQEDVQSILKEFDSYRVLELTPAQQRLCLGEPLPDEANRVWDILDNPFFVSRYCESKEKLDETASRWLSSSFSEWLNAAQSENRTSLMLRALLYEVNKLCVGKKHAVERKRFVLTKMLPALAYRKLLADRTTDSGAPVDGMRILEEVYVTEALLNLLNMYNSILKYWPEYRGQVDRNDFYQAWETYWKPGDKHIRRTLNRTEYFIGPLTTDNNRNYCFSHMIYQEFLAAFHIANVVCAIHNGVKISEESETGMDMICVLVEHIDHHILLQAEEILEQYWGIPFYSKPEIACCKYFNTNDDLSLERLIMCQILIRFLDASIMNSTSYEQENECKNERHAMYEWFSKKYLMVVSNFENFGTRYKQFYLYTVALLARDFRVGTGCSKDLNQCKAYVQQAINHQLELTIPKADGYLQMGLFLGTLQEQLINDNNSQIDNIVSQLYLSLDMADEILKLTSELCGSNPQLLSSVEEKYKIHVTSLTRSGARSYYILLKHAMEAYQQCSSSLHCLKLAKKLSCISKAYLVLSALGTSGGALNRIGLMFENQTNAMEHYPQTAIYQKLDPSERNTDLSRMLYEENYVHSYKIYQIISKIKRGDQPYSCRKLVELILKGRVCVENGLEYPTKGCGKRVDIVSSDVLIFLEQAAQKADNGIASMSYYWHGRILLIRANIEKSNQEFLLKSACDYFHKEEIIHGEERICYNDYLIAHSNIPINIMLAVIELLAPAMRTIDEIGFNLPLQNICQIVLNTLEGQFSKMYLKTDHPIFSNESYCVSPIDVLENITRFQENAHDLMDQGLLDRLKELQDDAMRIRESFW